ncbi:polyprenyl synthetase family protein [Fodinibius sediminis]|uniref:Geranylgeranyl diphosphate synthase, type II n=1 Tax=Fodinibius sediminis TaxID=1214077 RepID=A0A521DC40_9BACT|nr:polyprenyl synthetase family protein [Fodinibius sediminis]SMO69243.1 geranylgeranyl diphosphate synthase, type II [Fodinibius sediminis]
MQVTTQQELSNLIDEGFDRLSLPEAPASLYDPIRYTLELPGKRIRPLLTLIGCGLCEGDVKEALPAAIAVELLHNFTLLHDDIMDAAHTRRGQPSVYKKWDANTAILSGDAIYAKAFRQLQYYGYAEAYTKDHYAAIVDIFLDSAQSVCEGQAYDLDFEDKQEVTLEDYLKMIDGKTAALISTSLAIGARVATGDAAIIDRLRTIGKKTGIAFQIQDDLLDVVADPEKFGKQRGGDIREGKKTYLSLLALQRCSPEQRKRLSAILSHNDTSDDEVVSVIELYKELNVISATRSVIRSFYEEAMEHIDTFAASSYKDEIITLLNRLISREY